MMQKLSIVTVVYNEADQIRYTLENIAFLKKKIDFEYVVVDGESSDGTVGVIKEYVSIVDQFLSERDKGIYDAMNKGIRLANGEYIGLLNAGDTYEMQAVIEVFELIQSTTYELIYGALNILDEEKNLISMKQGISPKKMFFCGPKNLNHPTFFIRKKVYQELNFYSLDFDTASDFEFLYRAYLHGYKFYNTGNIHTSFLKGGASYKKSPYQKIRIYKKHFSSKPLWSLTSIIEKLFIKYPLFQIVKYLPKKIHFKYMDFKAKYLNY